ncbi:MAG TPA: NAD(P)-dependent oxidoreductase [Burkholderiales bacterium]|nr:NAD(P)-dependent oxidoreductase [Burkholderiales bacterium]
MAISVGFIGLGNMGNPMALNVLKSGFPLTVFDKVPKTMENLVAAGAKGAASAKAVLEACEVVLTCLPGSPEVEELYLGASGLLELAKPGSVFVDLSSVLPSTPRKLEARAKARGIEFLESPVSGGVTGARAATLAVMTGGDAAVLERVRPILKSIGPNIYHVGPSGSGNTVKAINNMLSTVNACAMYEGLMVGIKSGLDLKAMAEIIRNSSGNSNAVARVDRALIPRNFEPGFKVQLMNKDLETFNTIAKEMHVPVSFSNVAQRYQQTALAAGLGEKDTSVIFTLIEKLAGVTPPGSGA